MEKSSFSEKAVKAKRFTVLGVLVVMIVAAIGVGSILVVDSVNSEEYKIKQALGTGQLTAIMEPGWYMKNFGRIYTFPKVETVWFSSQGPQGSAKYSSDKSIEVIFSDNSKCSINGTVRINMPVMPEDAIAIVSKYSNVDFDNFETRNIVPLIRKSLIASASTMTAPDGKKRMNDIAMMALDQINNGMYELSNESVKEEDPISGEMVTKVLKRIRFKDNTIVRYMDDKPLKDFGVMATNMEVRGIDCNDQIEKQIAEQQQAQMAITTSKTIAARAEQDKITAEKEGDAKITRIQKEEEGTSQKLIVQAERDKQIEVINASKRVEVARQMVAEERLLLEATELQAKNKLIMADADARSAKLAIAADNLVPQKLAVYREVSIAQAEALKSLKLPQVLITGGDGKNGTGGGDMSLQILAAIALMNQRNTENIGLGNISNPK